MRWHLSNRADPRAVAIADRHYSRQKPGTPQFVPPGRCFVLLTEEANALWVTSWPFSQYVKHAWAGAWINSAFRSEAPDRASELILEAVAATRWYWSNTPPLGMITFIDTKHVKPIYRRGAPVWGYCYLKAGFEHVGFSKGGLVALQLRPEKMPPPERANGVQLSLEMAA